MDRHNVDCESGLLKGFTGGSSFKYQCNTPISKHVKTYTRETQNSQNGGIVYLDRQYVNCPDNSFLSQFRLTSANWWVVRFNFKCLEFETKSVKCTTRYTGKDEEGDGIRFLDRHKVSCNDDEFLKGFGGDSPGCYKRNWFNVCVSEAFRFKYECCKAEQLDPTPMPISKPTQNPVADPTHKPISDPTKEPVAHPTSHPVADPTHSPTDHPVAHPTHSPTDHPVASPTDEPISSPTLAPNPFPTMAPNRQEEIKLEKQQEVEAKAEIEALEEKKDEVVEEIQANKEKIADAENEEEKKNAVKEISRLEGKLNVINSNIEVNQNNLDAVAILEKEVQKGLVCPFEFESGVTKLIIPSGCSFFGVTDVNWSEQKIKNTPALYVCTSEPSPLELTTKELKHYGLVKESGKSDISFIQPGVDSTVKFYSEDNQAGDAGKFTKITFEPLFEYKYKSSGKEANDNVLSAVITSDLAERSVETCEELKFSDKMHLRVELMEQVQSKTFNKSAAKKNK